MNKETQERHGAVAGQVGRSVRPKLLWTVRVVREAYVLAESQEQAEEMVREIERWEEAQVEVDSGSIDLGWPGDCHVYHSGRDDITLAEARRKFAAAADGRP